MKASAARMAAAAAAVLCAVSAETGPARADSPGAFTVRNVVVDATAGNAAEARDKALAEGHSAAFSRLIARIVPMSAAGTAPKLGPDAIAPLVLSFGIDGEKTSRVRYLAQLTFRFDRAAVRRLLRTQGVRYAAAKAKPRLVLPVLRTAGTFLLWDRPNPWRDAWAELPRTDDLVPLLVPAGDLQDLRDISADQAVSGASGRLRAIADRYGAEAVIVALASRRAFGSPPTVDVSIVGEDTVASYPTRPDETAEQSFRSAAAGTAQLIQETWKESNLLFFDREGEIDAAVPVSGLDEWVAISRAVADTPSSNGIRVLSLSPDLIRVRLRYFGDAEEFAAALGRNDVRLRREGAGWVLTSAAARTRQR